MCLYRQVTDCELVERARAGDQTAFGDLVDRHRAAVFRAALAALGNREEAENVAQDAFVAAYRGLDGFRGDAMFQTWVRTIAWRRALNHRRALATRLRHLVTTRDDWPEPPAAGPSPEDALLADETRRRVTRVIQSLPVKLRDALLLTAVGDGSYEEIAAVLDVPVGTLKWRVSEARRLVKRKLNR